MGWQRDCTLLAIASGATLLLTSFPAFSLPRTATGRTKMQGEKAFVLSVGLTFRSAAAADQLLMEWSKIADYCWRNEPFLYHYEIARSDKKEHTYVITERYRSKEDYLHHHRTSAAFYSFRPTMKAMQDSGDVIVIGDSFIELGVGFT